MVKFECDNTIIIFNNAEGALEWLIANYESMNEYDLLSDYCCCFPAWVNSCYNAFDIVLDPGYYNYENLYELWKEEVLREIRNGYFYELEVIGEEVYD